MITSHRRRSSDDIGPGTTRSRSGLAVWLFALMWLLAGPASAASGDLDPLDLGIVGSVVLATTVQPDGKTIIGGRFSSVLGQPRNNIARINADGTLDASFNSDANGDVLSLALQADGQILLGRQFTQFGGTPRNWFARLINDPATQSPTAPNSTQVLWTRGGSAPDLSQVSF